MNYYMHEEEVYQKLVRVSNFWICNMKVMVIEIKNYQLKNILIKLEHT